MGKKVEVSYNPQLGYLQTIFHHNFDFLTGIKSYILQVKIFIKLRPLLC